MSLISRPFLIAIIFTLLGGLILIPVDAWDSDELKMFDLVEELGISFYDFLGVDKLAPDSDIKRAYRKLSVKYHPDKSGGDPEATAKFRNLVSVYEILKDKNLRESYDNVLENGLPTWRTPVFYYRKLRKMSNCELLIMFALLSTAIHYATLWGSRFERCWTLEEQLGIALKRQKARDRKREMIDLQIAEKLRDVPRPKWHDLLPFAICKFLYALIMCIPMVVTALRYEVSHKLENIQLQRTILGDSSVREKAKADKQERQRRVAERKRTEECTYDVSDLTSFLNLTDMPSELHDSNEPADDTKATPWTDQDIVNLVHAVARFPGGVPNRWDRIARQLNRTVSDVSAKARELGEHGLRNVYRRGQIPCDETPGFEVSMNTVCGDSSEEDGTFSHESSVKSKTEIRSQSPDGNSRNGVGPVNSGDEPGESATVIITEPYVSRKKLKQQKIASIKAPSERNATPHLSDGWTQVEQKQLEVAIRSIGKEVSERWDRIAECVPTKTKAEVMLRVKHLSNVVKTKSERSSNHCP